MKTLFTLASVSILSFCTNASTEIVLTEGTFKVSGLTEEVFYFGLHESDELIISLEEKKGKGIKEFEVIEYPENKIYSDFKTVSISNKSIKIKKTGVYKIRLYNGAMSGRICQLRLARIPGSDSTIDFDTEVHWKNVHDTTYNVVEEKFLVRSDTSIINVTDKTITVHSSGNLNGNKSKFNFKLPQNTAVWSYYIGVDQKGRAAFDTAVAKLSKNATPALLQTPGYGPLAALALNSASYLTSISGGEDINYWLVEGSQSANLFSSGGRFYYMKKGQVMNDFSRVESTPAGNLFFCFSNNNLVTPVKVTIKVTAIVVDDEYEMRPVEKLSVNTIKVPFINE